MTSDFERTSDIKVLFQYLCKSFEGNLAISHEWHFEVDFAELGLRKLCRDIFLESILFTITLQFDDMQKIQLILVELN